MLEYWNIGITMSIHYSNTPLFQYSKERAQTNITKITES